MNEKKTDELSPAQRLMAAASDVKDPAAAAALRELAGASNMYRASLDKLRERVEKVTDEELAAMTPADAALVRAQRDALRAYDRAKGGGNTQ